MRYAFIRDESKNHSIDLICKVLNVSRSGYYAFHARELSLRAMTNHRLMPLIRTIFNENRKAGYCRMSHALRDGD